VLLAGESRYSILRGPHLVDFGYGVGSLGLELGLE
jgi:hypothetical protein